MSNEELRKKLESNASELPILPQAVVRMISLDPSSDDYFDEVLEVIESEPNFAARLLSLANSAASASQAPITTLQGAIARVGSKGAAGLVVALSVTRVFVPKDDWEKSLWRHALQVAVAARKLATILDDDNFSPQEAYACGLLHDVGRFIMFEVDPDTLRRVDEGDWNQPEGLIEMEKSICGLTHADLGASACERWGLPDSVCDSVRLHHTKPSREASKDAKARQLVMLGADLLMFPSAIPGTPAIHETGQNEDLEKVAERLPFLSKYSIDQTRSLLAELAQEADSLLASLGLD